MSTTSTPAHSEALDNLPGMVIRLGPLRSRLTDEEFEKFCAQMREYIANGAQLGWLIDPRRHQVHLYHADSSVEILDHPQVISGEPLLPGFVLRLDGIID